MKENEWKTNKQESVNTRRTSTSLRIGVAKKWLRYRLQTLEEASQVTLHTGVAYIGASENSKRSVSFCSLSDSMEHGPKAIWGTLEAISTGA